MLVVSYGMVKSASTFTYQVLQAALQNHCKETGERYVGLSELGFDADHDFVSGITDLPKLYSSIVSSGFDFSQRDHLLLKTHLPASKFSSISNTEGFFSTASYRHPLEVALSLVDASKLDESRGKVRFIKYKNLEVALKEAAYQAECFLSWFNSYDSFLVYFDDIATNPLLLFERLFSELDLKVGASEILSEFHDKAATIAEFNKGLVGRRFREVDSQLLSEVEAEYTEIVSIIEGRTLRD